MTTVFLLSPAYCAGRRAAIILRPTSELEIAKRLRAGTLTLGEAFSFLSGLYFRGKITYTKAFHRSPDGTLVITPTRGLQSPDTCVTPDVLHEFAGVDISQDDARYADRSSGISAHSPRGCQPTHASCCSEAWPRASTWMFSFTFWVHAFTFRRPSSDAAT